MGLLAYEEQVLVTCDEVVAVSYRFFDTGALDIIRLGEHQSDDLSLWPAPSPRPTTAESARALEAHTRPDEAPRDVELEINDGLGL